MKRRDFLIGIGGAAMSPLGAKAQSGSVRRVGYLALSGRPLPPWIDAWLQGLRDNGYEEGRNLKIEWGLAAGKRELLPAMDADLVQKNVEVIVAGTSLSGVAAKKATRTIPIVVLASHDGIGSGLYDSLAHPGGNITGIESLSPALDAKRIEILKEMRPNLKTLAIFFNSTY